MKTCIDGMWMIGLICLTAWTNLFPGRVDAAEPARTISRSPDGVYAIVYRMLPEKQRVTEPAEGISPHDASLYLVRRDPYRVIAEIDPHYRSRWAWDADHYTCYWTPSGTKVAITFRHRRDSSLVLYEHHVKSGWRPAHLPELDWPADFTRIMEKRPMKERSNVMESGIDSVAFRKSGIVVNLSGFTKSDPPLDITLIYRLTSSAGRWKASVISEDVKNLD